MPEPRQVSTAKSAAKIMAAIFGSRILGLLREVVLSAIFGASRELDALKVAFRIPNLLRDLFGEGALSSAFVPTFSKTLTTDGKEAAFRLANLVFNVLVIVLSVICLIGILFSDFIVGVIAHDFVNTSGKLELTSQLTQIMFPFILFAALAALYMGLLNSLGSFGLPASASMAFNIVSIAAGAGVAWWLDPSFTDKAKCVHGFAVGVLLGGIAQWAVQIPRARKYGLRFMWIFDLKDSGLRKILTLMAPATIGVAAVQINVLVITYFAASFGDGAVTWLDNAFRLMQLPIGMFGVAISMVTLPAVSRAAARANIGEFKQNLQEGLRYMLFLAVPAAVGLVLLASPIIAALFQRGNYTAADTGQTAVLLQFYSIGLIGYSAVKVLSPAFYALDKVKFPVLVSVSGIVLNIVLNYLFIRMFKLGLYSLPLSVSIVAVINSLQLWFWLRRSIGGLFDRAFFISMAKVLAATFLMADMVWLLNRLFNGSGFSGQLFVIIQAVVVSGIGAAVYFGAAWLFKLEEVRRIQQTLMKKFKI